MISRYQIGNAQTIGCRSVQSNYFSTTYTDNGDLFAVLADGTIDHANGRKAAVTAVEYCVDSFLRNPRAYTSQFMLETAINANRRIQDAIFTGKNPRLSLTMILFTDESLQYFNVGVNKICLYNGHNEQILGSNANNSHSSGICGLSPKNIVYILSAGAHTDAHPMERIKIIESKKKLFDKTQAIIESVKVKGLNNQMNATALLIEVVK